MSFRKKVWLVRIGVVVLGPPALMLLALLAGVLILNLPILLPAWLWVRRNRETEMLKLLQLGLVRQGSTLDQQAGPAPPAAAEGPGAVVIPIRKGTQS